MTSATLGWLAGRGTRIHITCGNGRCDHMAANHYGLTLGADEAARRWGDDTTLVHRLRRKVQAIC
jgi:hypothetical protein